MTYYYTMYLRAQRAFTLQKCILIKYMNMYK